MKKKITIHDLLSIDVYLDTDDEDEEMKWFPLFINTPEGVICQFHSDELDSKSILRMDGIK